MITEIKTQQTRFFIIWFGQFLSSIGSGLTAFSVGVYIFQQTGSATRYSLIILAAFLPSLLLKPIGGVLSDRVDRRLLMIFGDLGSALGILFILGMMFAGRREMWVIYAGVIVSSVFVAFHGPAYKASVTDLVDSEYYTKASGLMQLAESSRYLISPLIAGFLLTLMSIESVLIIDVLTFLIAILTVFQVKKLSRKTKSDRLKKGVLEDLAGGFRYLFSNRGISSLLLITSLITFFVGFLQALLGPMILSYTDVKNLGMTLSVSATGMIVSSLFIGFFSKFDRKVPILSMALGLAGLFFALLGCFTQTVLVMVCGFLFFLTLPFINTCLDVLIRSNVANDIQGRVWSIVSLISQLGMILAFGIAGALADYVFNPLLQPEGMLASTVGSIIGTGDGRGIGLMFILSGLFVFSIALLIGSMKSISVLDNAAFIPKTKAFC